MAMNSGETASDDGDLDGRINAWKLGLTAIGAALVGAYFVYFALVQGQPAATDADKWGAFGDFVGGLLNPIVAFAAFYWLTQSVKLQRRELSETRAELRKTAESQQQLAEMSLASVQLATLSGLSTAAYSEIARVREVMESIGRNRPPDSERVKQTHYDERHRITLAKLAIANTAAQEGRQIYLGQMKKILELYGGAPLSGPPTIRSDPEDHSSEQSEA